MLRQYEIVRQSATRAAEAANGAVEALRERRVQQEPAFTDRMLGRIEQSMDGHEVNGVRWSARTFTDRGPGAQETVYGADFMGVLTINVPGYRVSKGFLAQAKLIEPERNRDRIGYERMRTQCERMLRLTAESFVFLYSIYGIRVVPAISVISADPCNPHELYSRSVARFFEAHFESFIGDIRLDSPRVELIDEQDQRFHVRHILSLTANWMFEEVDRNVQEVRFA